MVSNAADEIILDPSQIAQHYLRSWFFLDLVSSLPLDYLILLMSPETGVRQLMRAGKIAQLLSFSVALLTLLPHYVNIVNVSYLIRDLLFMFLLLFYVFAPYLSLRLLRMKIYKIIIMVIFR